MELLKKKARSFLVAVFVFSALLLIGMMMVPQQASKIGLNLALAGDEDEDFSYCDECSCPAIPPECTDWHTVGGYYGGCKEVRDEYGYLTDCTGYCECTGWDDEGQTVYHKEPCLCHTD
ncbi:MAG: hypothetical protein JRI96_14470 [Deltaproteobacteria bacterium]|nr:hypothetical protein [Deltaproteobacteria bacterium]